MTINLVRKMMSVGGMLATFAVAGFAQDAMKATIGFPFTAQGQKMDAGRYELKSAKIAGGNNTYFIRNLATGKMTLVGGFTANEVVGAAPDTARLMFQCNEGEYCALRQVWNGTRQYSEIIVSKKDAGDERLMEVALVRSRK